MCIHCGNHVCSGAYSSMVNCSLQSIIYSDVVVCDFICEMYIGIFPPYIHTSQFAFVAYMWLLMSIFLVVHIRQ